MRPTNPESITRGKQGYVAGPSVYYLGVYGYADAVYNASCSLSDVVPSLSSFGVSSWHALAGIMTRIGWPSGVVPHSLSPSLSLSRFLSLSLPLSWNPKPQTRGVMWGDLACCVLAYRQATLSIRQHVARLKALLVARSMNVSEMSAPLSNKLGIYKTVKARVWSWLSRKSP